jgi:hypothetical protein
MSNIVKEFNGSFSEDTGWMMKALGEQIALLEASERRREAKIVKRGQRDVCNACETGDHARCAKSGCRCERWGADAMLESSGYRGYLVRPPGLEIAPRTGLRGIAYRGCHLALKSAPTPWIRLLLAWTRCVFVRLWWHKRTEWKEIDVLYGSTLTFATEWVRVWRKREHAVQWVFPAGPPVILLMLVAASLLAFWPR